MFSQTRGVSQKLHICRFECISLARPLKYPDSIPRFHGCFLFMNSELAFHTQANSLLYLQWMIGVPYATTFMGCIGKDRFGEILEEKVHEAGVKSAYKYVDNEPTGTCAVCITEKHRSGKRN